MFLYQFQRQISVGFCMLALSFVYSSAQDFPVQRTPGALNMGSSLPVPAAFPVVSGAPYTADVLTQCWTVGPDGRTILREAFNIHMRDAAGRVRDERLTTPPDENSFFTQGGVTVIDPVSMQETQWNNTIKTVLTSPISSNLNSHRRNSIGFCGNPSATNPHAAPSADASPSAPIYTNLGMKTIEGLRVTGSRTTRTLPPPTGAKRPFTSSSETWVSTELHIIVLDTVRYSDGSGTLTKLTNIRQIAPDPALFEPPAGYGNVHAVYSGIALSTALVWETDGMPALRISLKNTGTSPVDVMTGMITDKVYPLDNFHFEIVLRDGRRFELFCWQCGPAGVAGPVFNYLVELAPHHTWTSDIPLTAFLYLDSREQHLDNAAAQKASLITKIKGYWDPQLDITEIQGDGDPQFENNQANPRTVWKGTESASITLPSITLPADTQENSDTPSRPKYVPPKKVRASPEVLAGMVSHRELPKYPDEALKSRTQGEVILNVVYDESGKVVLSAPVAGDPLLVAASVDALRGFRFRPLFLDTTPVKVEGQVRFLFSIIGEGERASGHVEYELPFF